MTSVNRVADAGKFGADHDTRITISADFGYWLARTNVSLAFSSYQTGRLFLVGHMRDGTVSVQHRPFGRAVGLYSTGNTLLLGSAIQIWRLENVLSPGERIHEHGDRLYVPRTAHTIGEVDAHEVALAGDGRIIFVNTRFSCLATLSDRHGFRPIWTPPFISALVAEDRCHLNGMAMEHGSPRYVTAAGCTDTKEGWRPGRANGGVCIDVTDGHIVAEGLSLPHSPRVHGDAIYLLNSGEGQLVRVDRASGAWEALAFCPGFLRGLAIIGDEAVVTLSRNRGQSLDGLGLGAELKRQNREAECAVLIIDLKTGDIRHSLHFDGEVSELFDVVLLPNVRCPLSLGLEREMLSFNSFDDCHTC